MNDELRMQNAECGMQNGKSLMVNFAGGHGSIRAETFGEGAPMKSRAAPKTRFFVALMLAVAMLVGGMSTARAAETWNVGPDRTVICNTGATTGGGLNGTVANGDHFNFTNNSLLFDGAGAFNSFGIVTTVGNNTGILAANNGASVTFASVGSSSLLDLSRIDLRATGYNVITVTGETYTDIVRFYAANSGELNFNGGMVITNIDGNTSNANYGIITLGNNSTSTIAGYANINDLGRLNIGTGATLTISGNIGKGSNADNAGAASTGQIVVNTGANLIFDSATNRTVGAVITGVGTLTKNNTNTTTVNSAVNVGAVTVTGGKLTINNTGRLTANTANITAGDLTFTNSMGTLGSVHFALDLGLKITNSTLNLSDRITSDAVGQRVQFDGASSVIQAVGAGAVDISTTIVARTTTAIDLTLSAGAVATNSLAVNTVSMANAANSTLTLNGNVGGLTVRGNVSASNAAGAGIIINGGTGGVRINGIISGGAAANDTLTVNGGKVTFTATNIYTGATIIDAGTLALGTPTSTGGAINNASPITINTGATLSFEHSGNGGYGLSAPLTINGGTILSNRATATSTITMSGAEVIVTGASSIILRNAGAYTISRPLNIADSASLTLTNNSTGAFTVSGAITNTGNGTIIHTGSNVVTLSGAKINNGTSLTLINNSAANLIVSTAAISGMGNLILSATGTGEIRMPFNNTYTGTTEILGGTIVREFASAFSTANNAITISGTATIGDETSTGGINFNNALIINNATLTYQNRPNIDTTTQNRTLTGGISGQGTVIFTARGIALTNNTIAVSGTITTLGTETLTLTKDAAFTNTLTLSGTINNAGTMTLLNNSNTGAYAVSGTVNNTGMMTLNNANNGVFTVGGTIANNGTLTLNNIATVSSTISGTGNIIKNSANNLTLSGNNTGFTGTIEIRDGTLTRGGTNAFGTTGATVFAGTHTTIIDTQTANLVSNIAVGTNVILTYENVNEMIHTGTVTLNNNSQFTADGNAQLTLGSINVNGANATIRNETNTILTLGALSLGTGQLTLNSLPIAMNPNSVFSTSVASTITDGQTLLLDGATLRFGTGGSLNTTGTGVLRLNNATIATAGGVAGNVTNAGILAVGTAANIAGSLLGTSGVVDLTENGARTILTVGGTANLTNAEVKYNLYANNLSDQIIANNYVGAGGTTIINLAYAWEDGDFTLLSFANELTTGTATFTVAGVGTEGRSGATLRLADNRKSLILKTTSNSTNLVWTNGSSTMIWAANNSKDWEVESDNSADTFCQWDTVIFTSTMAGTIEVDNLGVNVKNMSVTGGNYEFTTTGDNSRINIETKKSDTTAGTHFGHGQLLVGTGTAKFNNPVRIMSSAGSASVKIHDSGTVNFSGATIINNHIVVDSGKLEIGGAGMISDLGGANGVYSENISLVNNNAQLVYSSSATQTLHGVISGAGAVSKNGGGTSTLFLTNNNIYTGSTSVTAGTLYVSGMMGANNVYAGNIVVGDGTATDTLVLAQSGTQTFRGVISGGTAGVIRKIHNNELILSGNSANYAGEIINDSTGLGVIRNTGTLKVTGTFTNLNAVLINEGNLTVANFTNGGRLDLIGGVFNVGAGTTTNLGNAGFTNGAQLVSNGTVNLDRDITIALHDKYKYDVLTAGANAAMVAGTVTNTTNRKITLSGGNVETQYAIIKTTAGEDANVAKAIKENDSAIYKYTFINTGNVYAITKSFGKREDMVDAANTDSKSNAGIASSLYDIITSDAAKDKMSDVIEQLASVKDTDPHTFSRAVTELNGFNLASGVTQIGNAAIQQNNAALGQFFSSVHTTRVASQFLSVDGGNNNTENSTASAGGKPTSDSVCGIRCLHSDGGCYRWDGFIKAYGGFGANASNANAAGYDFGGVGVIGGFGYKFNNELTLGGIVGFSYNTSSLYEHLGLATDNLLRMGLSAQFNWGGFFVNSVPTFGIHLLTTERYLDYFGTKTKGERTGVDMNWYNQVGYTFEFPRGIMFTPSYSLSATFMHDAAYTETGGDNTNLHFHDFNSWSLVHNLEARFGKTFYVGKTAILPEVWAGWENETLESAYATMNFAVVPSESWRAPVARIANNRATFGAGITTLLSNKYEIYGRWDQKIWEGGFNTSFTVGASVKF